MIRTKEKPTYAQMIAEPSQDISQKYSSRQLQQPLPYQNMRFPQHAFSNSPLFDFKSLNSEISSNNTLRRDQAAVAAQPSRTTEIQNREQIPNNENTEFSESCILLQTKNSFDISQDQSKSNNKLIRNRQHWSTEETAKYIKFCKDYFNVLNSKDMNDRKAEKIFVKMSNFIRTRSSDQCRSHHQKKFSQLKRRLLIEKEFPGKSSSSSETYSELKPQKSFCKSVLCRQEKKHLFDKGYQTFWNQFLEKLEGTVMQEEIEEQSRIQNVAGNNDRKLLEGLQTLLNPISNQSPEQKLKLIDLLNFSFPDDY